MGYFVWTIPNFDRLRAKNAPVGAHVPRCMDCDRKATVTLVVCVPGNTVLLAGGFCDTHKPKTESDRDLSVSRMNGEMADWFEKLCTSVEDDLTEPDDDCNL